MYAILQLQQLFVISVMLCWCANGDSFTPYFFAPNLAIAENETTSSINFSHHPSTTKFSNFSASSTYKSSKNSELLNESPFLGELSNLTSLPDILPLLLGANGRCGSDFAYSGKAAMSGELWALKLFDSWGKPRSFLDVTTFQIAGDYHKCRNILSPLKEANSSVRFRGNYCVVVLAPKALQRKYAPAGIHYGICMPDTCSGMEITSFGNTLFNMHPQSADVNAFYAYCINEDRQVTTATVIAA